MSLQHNFTEVSSKLELIAAPHSNRDTVGSNPCEEVHSSIPPRAAPSNFHTEDTAPLLTHQHPTAHSKTQPRYSRTIHLSVTAPPLSSTAEHRASTCFNSPLRTATPFCGKPTCRSSPALGCAQPTVRRCPAASRSTQRHGGPALRRHVRRSGRRHGAGGATPGHGRSSRRSPAPTRSPSSPPGPPLSHPRQP